MVCLLGTGANFVLFQNKKDAQLVSEKEIIAIQKGKDDAAAKVISDAKAVEDKKIEEAKAIEDKKIADIQVIKHKEANEILTIKDNEEMEAVLTVKDPSNPIASKFEKICW
ncbi:MULTISPECIES: hypothetical protein [Clostridium]|uniref:Uncharacterized protein n=1 Tax=Clostridium frigoriphilum TaxID=443253 RepID=A0ABU7UXD6_9CLOT|nr:hypothetical protein [Clostridium sp. DSM 17811]MBU3102246.1 hypothetical protein [Clostridium sp. DSM 17811]